MTTTTAATRRWFNDTKVGNYTIAEAFVIMFLYEYLTKDDDDVAADRLNAFIEKYAELFPELQTQSSTSDNIVAKQFKKESMSELRQRIMGDDYLGSHDNGAYKTLLQMCRQMFTDPRGRQHYYNLVYHMEDIIYEENADTGVNTKGYISGAPSSEVRETWQMPDVGDDGGTEVTKMDWVLFGSLANATALLSKGAMDKSIAEGLLDKASGQSYDDFLSKVDRFFGNPSEASAQYSTISAYIKRKQTKGPNRGWQPRRDPGKFIALQYPVKRPEAQGVYADSTILWKVKKESDGTYDKDGVPYILTDEAIELKDWSEVTGKLLTLDDDVQYWHADGAPNAFTANKRRVVGDERGHLTPRPEGGMVRLLKDGFVVDGTFEYAPSVDNGAPHTVILGGLGVAPTADQKAPEIWDGPTASHKNPWDWS